MKRWIGLGVVLSAMAVPAWAEMPAESAAPQGGIRVEKIAVGTAVENRELLGEATTFGADTTRLICWTKVVSDNVPAEVRHVWSVDGNKEAEVPLALKYASMRTWSSKNVWPGAWKVEVIDTAGAVLSSVEFTVQK